MIPSIPYNIILLDDSFGNRESPCEKVVEEYFICDGPQDHVMTCQQTMITKGLSSNYEFPVRARVCLPHVKISRKRVDFAIRTVNEVYKVSVFILLHQDFY